MTRGWLFVVLTAANVTMGLLVLSNAIWQQTHPPLPLCHPDIALGPGGACLLVFALDRAGVPHMTGMAGMTIGVAPRSPSW